MTKAMSLPIFTAGMSLDASRFPQLLGDLTNEAGVLDITVARLQALTRKDLTLANGANNNLDIGTDPTGNTWVRIAGPTGAFSVSGFAGGQDGRVLILFNSVAQAMTLTNNATSTAANRILTLTGADVVLRAGTSCATLIYSGTDSRWIVVATN